MILKAVLASTAKSVLQFDLLSFAKSQSSIQSCLWDPEPGGRFFLLKIKMKMKNSVSGRKVFCEIPWKQCGACYSCQKSRSILDWLETEGINGPERLTRNSFEIAEGLGGIARLKSTIVPHYVKN